MITDQDKDLIKRLREVNAYEQPTEAEVDLVEAADRIEKLLHEISLLNITINMLDTAWDQTIGEPRMTFDPTTNRIQFGLLTTEERKIMNEWPHGMIWYDPVDDLWRIAVINVTPWWETTVYRGLPEPVRVTTWAPLYSNGYPGFGYDSRAKAIHAAVGTAVNSKNLIGILRIDITSGVPTVCVEEV